MAPDVQALPLPGTPLPGGRRLLHRRPLPPPAAPPPRHHSAGGAAPGAASSAAAQMGEDDLGEATSIKLEPLWQTSAACISCLQIIVQTV